VGLEPGLLSRLQTRTASIRHGVDVDQARADFEAAWASLLPEIPSGAFEEYRRDREHRAEIRAIQARGEKLPIETPSSLMCRVCGVTFDSHWPAESYDDRLHIYAARQASDFDPRAHNEKSIARNEKSKEWNTGL
jgi:hypothetical protein